MSKYKKLVRDLIPDIILNNGEYPVIKILNDDEYKFELEKKLFEEYNEVIDSVDVNERIEELADMYEVIRSLAELEGKSMDDVVTVADKKRDKRGGFSERIYLEKVIECNGIKIHSMNLQDRPFKLIADGTKTIEMRLYDEKRRLINKGDIIEFNNDKVDFIISTQVLDLHVFSDFDELYNHFDKVSLGYDENSSFDSSDMEKYYNKSKIKKYGVVGIELKKL